MFGRIKKKCIKDDEWQKVKCHICLPNDPETEPRLRQQQLVSEDEQRTGITHVMASVITTHPFNYL